jgi:hypothetical protein
MTRRSWEREKETLGEGKEGIHHGGTEDTGEVTKREENRVIWKREMRNRETEAANASSPASHFSFLISRFHITRFSSSCILFLGAFSRVLRASVVKSLATNSFH